MVEPHCDNSYRLRISELAPAQQGFTLIELLVVIVVLSILAAIATPSFLSYAARSKQASALKYLGVVNRAQQVFFIEHDRFASSTAELGFIDTQAPPDYTYTITSTTQGINITRAQAIPRDSALRGYAGVVFTTIDPSGIARLDTRLCKGTVATTPTPAPVTVGGQVQITNCNTL